MSEKFLGVNLSWKKIILNNFLGGIAWGFGATVGVSLILALISFVASNIDFVPMVGDFVLQVTNFIESKR